MNLLKIKFCYFTFFEQQEIKWKSNLEIGHKKRPSIDNLFIVENIGVTLFYRLAFEEIIKPKAYSYACMVFSFYTNLKLAWLSKKEKARFSSEAGFGLVENIGVEPMTSTLPA